MLNIPLSADSMRPEQMFDQQSMQQYLLLLQNYKEHMCACQVLQLCPTLCVRLFATPLTVTCQAPLSMGFSRQKY